MSLVSNRSKKVFLCKDTKISSTEKIDIILSPEFYWVRVFDLPVKNISQARHVLPTLFEDILENVKELSYQVQKYNDKYLCFAYENKKVFQAIKNSGINLSSVNAVYFAQNECEGIEQFKCEDKAFSYTQDQILVKIPKSFLSDNIDINDRLDDIKLSSNKVDIKLYNNLLNSKQIGFIIAISLIFAVVNFIKIYDYNSEIKSFDEKIESIKSSSKMPSSILQANSIINSYEKDVKKEIEKRAAIEYFIKNGDFNILNVSLDKDIVDITFSNANKIKIEKYISKRYKIISSNMKDLNLNVRIKL